MSTVEVEQILVVPTQLFRDCGYFEGYTTDVEKYLPILLDGNNTSYQPRDQMEQDPSFKQLIPYCLFEYHGPKGIEVFQYTRGSGQGESRLHSKRSVGIGGHISTLDSSADSVYEQGLQRELDEEVIVETDYVSSCVGLINDDSNDVGRVHLGVVHRMKVDAPKVQSREKDIIDAGFQPIESILADLERFETWSQICLKAIYDV